MMTHLDAAKQFQMELIKAVRTPLAIVLAASTLVLTPAPVHAKKVYKWFDDAGNVHYGDSAPGGTNRQEVRIRKTPELNGSLGSRNERTQRLLDSFASERAEKKSRRATAAAEQKKREEQCKEAQQEQWEYEHAGFLYKQGENGERIILDGAEYDAAIERVRAAAEASCK